MTIKELNDFKFSLKCDNFHVLTFAETGFAMLNIYADQFEISTETINQFAKQVNRKNESGSLHPVAPISAVPRRCIRNLEDSAVLAHHIIDFLQANHRHIKAKKILFDFRAGVAPFVIEACRIALASEFTQGVEEVIVINEN